MIDGPLPETPEITENLSQENSLPEDDTPQVDEMLGVDPTTVEEPEPTPEQHVSRLALQLFDQTEVLHGLDDCCRQAMEAVGMLYSAHIPHSKKKPFQGALSFIREQEHLQLVPEMESVVAATLIFHQARIKKKGLDALGLSPIQQRQILTIAAILRIAVGLNDSRSSQTTIEQIAIDRFEMWIVVDGPQAESDAAVAQLNTDLWTKIGYPQTQVLVSADAALRRLPYPEPQEQVGILPSDTLAEAGRKVMRYQFALMLKNEAGTRLGEDIEALHDMRVATRRMRASFEVFETAFEPGALKPFLKGLRATGRALGSVRDLDVFMEKAQAYLKTLPDDHLHDLDLLLNAWQEQRSEARTKMLEFLDSQEYDDFKRKFNVFINTPGAGARNLPADQPTPALVRELAPVLIYTRLAGVRAFAPFLNNAPIEQLHALRIEFKKLRYTVEYFREVLGRTSELVINELKLIQDHLGDLNDAQVATQILREFIEIWEPRLDGLPLRERPNFEPLVQYMAARHAEKHQLMNSFPTTWKNFSRPRFRRYLAQAVAVL